MNETRLRSPQSDVPMEIPAENFRALGHRLVDQLADFYETLRERPVTPGERPRYYRALVGDRTLPEDGSDPGVLLEHAADLLIANSLFNGHPRFWGYVTSSAGPLGALADFLAAALNQNVGAWELSPLATEIEKQCIRWLAELIGFPTDCGGVLVSGGNMANFVPVLAAQRAKAPWDLRAEGPSGGPPLRLYASDETHTWIQSAADLFGLGTDAIRWIPCDRGARMDPAALRDQIAADLAAGDLPFLVCGTAGTVSTGAVDPLAEIAAICREHDLWFHVDGAYGAPAAVVPELADTMAGLREADSIALDPHKWLYCPLEAGCALVRRAEHLPAAFSFRPDYYRFEGEDDDADPPTNFYEWSLQNSRGFRALKVWLAIQQVGRDGYEQMIREDIDLSRAMFAEAERHPELEALSHSLSITTFRYVPHDLDLQGEERETYLKELNTELLSRLRSGGRAYLSNAIVGETFALRACIVNFRTTDEDVAALPALVIEAGRETHAQMKRDPSRLSQSS